jgi:amidase/aspartyl-tRNA(Asn)/glutamyl-tRNA(Gln) amidotransferase subunit A
LPGLDAEVAHACQTAAERLTRPADVATRDELLAAFAPALATYGTVVADEAWSVHHAWAERFRERYDPAVWSRLSRGAELTAAQREHARRTTAAIKRTWTQYFRDFDFLVLPASPSAALTKAECTPANRSRLLSLTAPASIGGLPVLTLPVRLPAGLTTGLQVVVSAPQVPTVAWALEKFTRE